MLLVNLSVFRQRSQALPLRITHYFILQKSPLRKFRLQS